MRGISRRAGGRAGAGPSGPSSSSRSSRSSSAGSGSRWDPFWALLLLLPPLLLLPSLDDALLWQDEAETALLARQVLAHGLPVATDAGRLLSDQLDRGDISAEGLWIWSPWLPHYVTAASFALFGESTRTARLPFVLAGWATLLLSYPVFRRLTASRATARLAVLLLALSVPFLMMSRQCRYYALAALLSVAFLAAYGAVRPRRGFAGMALAAAALAYTFPPQIAVLGLAATLHAAAVRRDRALVARVVGAGMLAAAAFGPFFVYGRMWDRSYGDAGQAIDSWLRYATTLRAYVLEIHIYTWPFVLAVPLAWRALAALPESSRRVARAALAAGTGAWLVTAVAPPTPAFLAAFLAFTLAGSALAAGGLVLHARRAHPAAGAAGWALIALALALGTPLLAMPAPFPFFRYLAGQLPLFALASAGTIRGLLPHRPLAAWGLAAAIVVTDAIAVAPFLVAGLPVRLLDPDRARAAAARLAPWAQPAELLTRELLRERPSGPRLRVPLWDHAQELLGEYRGPVRAVVEHLRAQARPGELLLTSSSRYSLLFYTDLRVERFEEADALPELPDWIWQGPRAPRLPERIRSALSRDYERVRLEAVWLPWENIPEPYWHRFRTPARTDPGTQTVVTLLRRRSRGEEAPSEVSASAPRRPLTPPRNRARGAD